MILAVGDLDWLAMTLQELLHLVTIFLSKDLSCLKRVQLAAPQTQ